MKKVDSYSIDSSAKSIQTGLETIEKLVTNFQIDLDTNDYMRESLDWDYMDVRKTLNLLEKQVNDLVNDSEKALNDEEYDIRAE